MKYTDMCIYIDENVPKLLNPGEYPEIEEKIYNYLWLLVKALAIKKCMFPNFDDYDQYSFYAANRLFFALRKNLTNQGKTIKGKYIKPIKSCLNYTKALLYPMKIEYLRQAYKEVLDTRFVSKQFDPDKFKNNLKQSARESLGENQLHMQLLRLSLGNMSGIVDRVMKRTPIHINGLDYKYLRISLLLTAQECLRTKGALVDSSCTVVL